MMLYFQLVLIHWLYAFTSDPKPKKEPRRLDDTSTSTSPKPLFLKRPEYMYSCKYSILEFVPLVAIVFGNPVDYRRLEDRTFR